MDGQLSPKVKDNYEDSFKQIIDKVLSYNSEAEVTLLQKAFRTAEEMHTGQMRESGEPYIIHPLAVARTLADLHLDTVSIASALLHDVAEDTDYDLKRVEKEFGSEIAAIIEGVTKIDTDLEKKLEILSKEEVQAENIRRMILAMSKDIRVILIKIADRLHNMRTISWMPVEKQKIKARETLDIFAPLTNRLGISQIKWELEDLSFAILEPKAFKDIQRMVNQKLEAREAYLKEVEEALSSELTKVGIDARIKTRPKHFYSIYKKMYKGGKEFNELYDLSGVRVVAKSLKDCYGAIGIIHSNWTPIPGRFKDYIAMPKLNMYQSLHTTVIGPAGRPLEIQVRTENMHQTAEMGIAAHWKYKEGASRGKDVEEQYTWLRDILDQLKFTDTSMQWLSEFKDELFSDEVFVFTPKGDVKALPRDSTPIDFAFAIHTDVGTHCIGAKINNQIIPLDHKLKSGDFVEVLTSKQSHPNKDWLRFVKTTKARNKIRQWYTKELRDDSEHDGREALFKVLRLKGVKPAEVDEKMIEDAAREFNFHKLADVYSAIGMNSFSPKQLATKIMRHIKKTDETGVDDLNDLEKEIERKRVKAQKRPGKRNSGIRVQGMEDVMIRLAQCCNPIPYDDIMGFITNGRGVSVHRSDCVNAGSLRFYPERVVVTEWDIENPGKFPVNLQVDSLDRPRLLRDVTTAISDKGINILKANVSSGKTDIASLQFTIEITDLSDLNPIIREIKKIEGVRDVFRIGKR